MGKKQSDGTTSVALAALAALVALSFLHRQHRPMVKAKMKHGRSSRKHRRCPACAHGWTERRGPCWGYFVIRQLSLPLVGWLHGEY